MTQTKPKTTYFQDILKRGASMGIKPGKIKFARWWFRRKAQRVAIGDAKDFIKTERDMRHFKRNEIMPGYLYMFIYDAKLKDKLPYWDAFPIVFPWRTTYNAKTKQHGFIGINLHYLPYKLRAILMDELYTIASNERYNDNTKLKLSYEKLREIASDDLVEPCIHQYLLPYCKSKFFKIPAAQWDIALFMDAAKFQKASAEKVWADSAAHKSKRKKKKAD